MRLVNVESFITIVKIIKQCVGSQKKLYWGEGGATSLSPAKAELKKINREVTHGTL